MADAETAKEASLLTYSVDESLILLWHWEGGKDSQYNRTGGTQFKLKIFLKGIKMIEINSSLKNSKTIKHIKNN